MALQRSVGGFDFMLPPDERTAFIQELRTHLQGGQQ
jgi:hypothetical protein